MVTGTGKQQNPLQQAAIAHPVIMTIAGSDSGGGAGIQADIKTITALGGFATSVIAALTAQNGQEVRGFYPVPADFVVQQLLTVQDGFPVRAAKTGMLASKDIVVALGKELPKRNYPLVVDPVCMSQSGHRLIEKDAIASMVSWLLPQADLFTPNRPEAEEITGLRIASADDVQRAVEALFKMGARAVLLKGGHFDDESEVITDWLAVPGGEIKPLQHSRVQTNNNHGTGCTLAAATATFLGFGHTLEDAVVQGRAYLHDALAAGYAPGIGAGPPNFMARFFK